MKNKQTSIVIYKPSGKAPKVKVRLEGNTVWLDQKQISALFLTDRSVIAKHINNIYKTGELIRHSTCAKIARVQQEGNREIRRQILVYNLDLFISVGYRVNSKIATQFRIWATNVLRNHLVKGYTINESRLKTQAYKYQELLNSVKLLENVLDLDEITQKQARGIIEVVTDYAYALDVLDQYDFKTLSVNKTTKKEYYKLDYKMGMEIIKNLKSRFGGSDIFGVPKDERIRESNQFMNYQNSIKVRRINVLY